MERDYFVIGKYSDYTTEQIIQMQRDLPWDSDLLYVLCYRLDREDLYDENIDCDELGTRLSDEENLNLY